MPKTSENEINFSSKSGEEEDCVAFSFSMHSAIIVRLTITVLKVVRDWRWSNGGGDVECPEAKRSSKYEGRLGQ